MIKISYNYSIQLDDQAWIVVIKYLVMDSMFWCNDFLKFLMTMSLYFISFWSFFPPTWAFNNCLHLTTFSIVLILNPTQFEAPTLMLWPSKDTIFAISRTLLMYTYIYQLQTLNPPMQMLNFHLKSFIVQQSSLTCEKIKHML